jgi:hypothetical protein
VAERLDTVQKYFAEILEPEFQEFFSRPSTFRNTVNLARSLFHFHEWMWRQCKGNLEAHFGKSLKTPGSFLGEMEKIDSRFGYIRDVANASKHVVLDGQPSTSMKHIANTYIEQAAFQSNTFQRNAFQTGGVKMKDEGKTIVFDECAKAFSYWKALLAKLCTKDAQARRAAHMVASTAGAHPAGAGEDRGTRATALALPPTARAADREHRHSAGCRSAPELNVKTTGADGKVTWVFDEENFARQRLRIKARKMILARMAPRKYGNP